MQNRGKLERMGSCVIALNWNGWKHTIECLESVFRLNCSDFRVVVCDNASNDGSIEKIKEWARGGIPGGSANPQLSRLSSPPFPKPISYHELTREQAESGTASFDARLVLIQNGANLGFAGGNNVGLRYALGDANCQFFWMLNNDTVVESDALSAMVRLMQKQPEIGLCGSLNLSYYNPKEVVAQGGQSYCSWTAHVPTPPLCMVDELDSLPAAPIDFVNGASMLVSRAFLEKVGLMEESYFLYFEELDWAMRAKGKFNLGYARESVIYHKVGATIGTNRERMKCSLLSQKYTFRNRVLFTKRFFPWALPSVLIWLSFVATYWLWRGDSARAKLVLKSMLEGLKVPTPRTRR